MRRKRLIILLVIAFILLLAAGASYWCFYLRTSTPPSTPTPYSHTTPSSTTQTPPQAFDKHHYSTTDPASPWVIVNKQHPLNPPNYTPSDLKSVGNGQQMRAEAADALQHMFTDAQAVGFTLVADSGYRSYDTQTATYNSVVKAYGQTQADTVSARPGYSEHQTGWAVDLGTGDCHVADCFADTPSGQWALSNAYKYGFLLRYPDSLTGITGYSHEAWHFRYIGTMLSEELHKQNVPTLEQFFDISGGTTYK